LRVEIGVPEICPTIFHRTHPLIFRINECIAIGPCMIPIMPDEDDFISIALAVIWAIQSLRRTWWMRMSSSRIQNGLIEAAAGCSGLILKPTSPGCGHPTGRESSQLFHAANRPAIPKGRQSELPEARSRGKRRRLHHDLLVCLRLYSPLEPFFDKSWRPSEIELVK
jgi:hypothetical protein